jgi:hypothetical protein
MDVRQLAPSLLALAEVFDLAYQEASDGYTLPPSLEVRATEEGSFAVDLLLAMQDGAEGVFEWAKTPDGQAAGTLIGIAGAALAAIKWTLTRRRRGQESGVEEIAPGTIRVHWPDGTKFEAPVSAQALAASMDFNRVAGEVFEPLRHRGIETIELQGSRRVGSHEMTVVRDDLPAFNITEPEDDLISDNVRIVAVRLVSLTFKEGNKWRISDGNSVFWASLHDLGFLQRVTSNEEVFARDDILRVRLRDQQFRTATGGFRMEHQIEKVLEHRRGTPHEPLPFDFENGGGDEVEIRFVREDEIDQDGHL